MKQFLTIIICLLLCSAVYYKQDYITNEISNYFINTPALAPIKQNEYSKIKNYEFVKTSNNLVPYNYQDLLDIFYTILDAGYDTYTFYCPAEYLTCVDDVAKISNPNNVDTLTSIGNFISPFNNFTSLKVKYDTAGEVTVDVTHLYTDEEITKINTKIDEIWNEIVKEDMSETDIIYAFHDYIINNTKYDKKFEEEVKNGKTTYQSNKAIGPLFEGYAICSGYTDTMAIILDRLKINNYKVASDTHVWNALYIKLKDEDQEKWVHLDLTWDDPVAEVKEGQEPIDTLLHKFYLIDTKTLEDFDIEDHTFNKSIYIELK